MNDQSRPARDELEPDHQLALEHVLRLMAIPGPSGQEDRVAAYVTDQLLAAGVPAAAIATDDAHRASPLGGTIGNLTVTLPGTIDGPRRLLMAHLDTVPVFVGAKPAVTGDRIRTGQPQTGVGA